MFSSYPNPLYEFGKDIIGPVIGGAAVWVVASWKNYRERRRKYHIALGPRDHFRDLRIHEILTELLVRTGAIRAYLSRFVNGETFTDGSDLIKKIRTHEVTGRGVIPQATIFQSILTSRIPDEMALVTENGHSFTFVRDLKESMFKQICLDGNTGAIARAALKNNKGQIVGFIGLDFPDDIEKVPENIDLIMDCARRIEMVNSNL